MGSRKGHKYIYALSSQNIGSVKSILPVNTCIFFTNKRISEEEVILNVSKIFCQTPICKRTAQGMEVKVVLKKGML